MKDFVLTIKDGNGREAKCRCRVQKIGNYSEDGAVVLFSELPNNEGMSITNASETFATVLVKMLTLNPTRSIFVEHYDRLTLYSEAHVQHEDTHTFDLITYTWEGNKAHAPSWTRVTQSWVEILFKQDLLFLRT